MRTDNQIQNEVEEFLLSGYAFAYILKSNPNLYMEQLDLLLNKNQGNNLELNLKKINFNYKPDGIKFIGKPIIKKFGEVSNGSINYFEALYITDFDFEGYIYISEINQIRIKLEATLRIFTINSQVPIVNGLIEIPTIINVLATDSFMVLDRNEKQNEIKKLEDQFKIKIEQNNQQ